MNLMAMKQILEEGSANGEKFGTLVFTLSDDGKLFIRMMPIKEKEFFVYLHEYVNEMVKAENIRYIVITDDLGDRLVSIGFSKEDHIVIGTEYKKENGEALFYENDYFTGTSKVYENGYKITFLLPKEGMALADAMEKLDGSSLNDLYDTGEYADVDLYIPEFGFDYKAPDCIGSLKDMGIETVFDENNADLSDMAVCNDGSNLFVNLIIHKTHVELDREGTKAAAATVIGIAKNSVMPMERPKREVRLDRPFAFIISDVQTNTPIFIGTVGSIG